MQYDQLKHHISSGLLSFPVTHFDKHLEFAADSYAQHLQWLNEFDAAALFAAGGTGEMFSLTPAEIVTVATHAKHASEKLPILSGCGYGTKMACEIAQQVEKNGVDGILLLPPYLTECSQDGIYNHVKAVCNSVDFGVVIYNRANAQANADTVAKLADNCPNLIGFKDGTGDINTVRKIVARCGDRLAYIGGMPTHEVYAEAYNAMRVTTYSSAVFNFVPDIALRFYRALRANDRDTMHTILTDFFYPLLDIRDRKAGYAVALIKAGVNAVGVQAGSVRPPLTDITDTEMAMLHRLLHNHNIPTTKRTFYADNPDSDLRFTP